MAVERAPGGSSLIDVLDRVLDKGIVIDAWVRVSLVGIDLVTVEARIVVASIDTYLRFSEAVGITAPSARPRELTAGGEAELDRVHAGERGAQAPARRGQSTRARLTSHDGWAGRRCATGPADRRWSRCAADVARGGGVVD